ncbi:N-acetylglucosamine-6-phosphate deacetylase [Georgenia deserti]|uniref:N-acetylglucosamine-6-phosphate deacetylase n=1 Tax=Georgenia deserti TaxID=2093781 RepID=A0ABW4L2F6_9MICO
MIGRDPRTGRTLEVRVHDGRIAEVRPGGPGEDGMPWLVPGLVDLQVNGFAGHDLNGPDVSPDDVAAVTAALARAGTTSYVPTIITAAEAEMARSLRAVAEARRLDPATRRAVPFVHLEGPSISTEDGPRGVHPAEHVRPPDLAELHRLQEAADGLVGMVTLSPHHAGAIEFTRAAVAEGVRVAVGHTHATGEQIRAVVDAGARVATHLGNGAHATLPRHPNYLWAQLAEDRLTAGFIADGHHLPADTLTVMLRAKGAGRAVLVSDSVALAGLPPGEYTTPVGGRVRLGQDGRLGEVGTPYLAGAARPLAAGVATVSRLPGWSLADALELATTAPGRLVGDGRGTLETGAPADLLLLDEVPEAGPVSIREVVLAGERVV